MYYITQRAVRNSSFFLLAFAVGALLLQPIWVHAQSMGDEIEFVDEFVSAPAGTVSCFDYYEFGSVQANLTAPVTGTVSGVSIPFSGTIQNNNSYPIVDGALYVKIFKSRGSSNDGNGPDVVDQFLAKGDIVIPANGSVPVSFSWRVPSYAMSGDYSLATFFLTSRKFNLLGLSFTDDVVGNTVPFKVSGEQTDNISFDKAGVTVDGDSYRFAAFPPRTSSTNPVNVTARVRNTTSESQRVSVSWTVYQWDAQLRENAVQEETKSVTVPAGGSAPISITVTDSDYPVYLAVGTLSWKDTKSIIGVRFVREGVDRTRINFPSITSFPLVQGQENTLFSCLHNSGESSSVPDGRLELVLLDSSDNLIHQYVYSGGVTGAMMGVAESFVPDKDYDFFTLEARLFSGDNFVDEARLVYDCNNIDPSLCNLAGVGVGADFLGLTDIFGEGSFGTVLVVIILVALLIIAVAVRMFTNRLKPPTDNMPPSSGMPPQV
jgi:hypothetical protein